jgi:serine O-acetyltransferase
VTARQRLRADLARYGPYRRGGFLQRLKTVVLTEGIWATVLYRFGQYLADEAPALVRVLISPPYKLIHKVVQLMTGIHLDPPTRAGPGLYIGHYGGIWISPAAVLGANCNISQGVTIGRAGRIAKAAPRLGDRVWVGPNATISGPVRVGSGAVVAANTLVVAHVPENAVVIGVPSRVLSYSGSANLIDLPEAGAARASAPDPPPPAGAPPLHSGADTD